MVGAEQASRAEDDRAEEDDAGRPRRVQGPAAPEPRPSIVDTPLEEPADLTRALARNKQARENFANFAPSYRRAYLYWIAIAKKPETRARRIVEAVERLA